ncbi:DNA helicase/exodeoxyribonuclease V, subunit A [Peptoclostridium litorale DSM 5388]|uniref:ATP-dependent helicase/nuclease subunit A n=1 Tax=Peptoclostridium litorale DSM 5388 TaxID=1121324 RepID=A0A069RCG8_PEPLI|nr:helicase-exonuclease AddAB subunit AddA [Peptoclostridium litorale]KDR94716.1 ATP-dependent helicase/nuclease subunit A [Peptoclostridium litorale DSM 5388]SIO33029.1 DNA helicase/exodeoxyribonuclease V, subunit A [Peptoclostridium litorale DSM 5388]
MNRWTSDQKAAIDQRGSNLLVSAAAGSGKTAVLVQRIIDIVTIDKIDIDKFLIVTFTNAAAGEMRERILSALSKKIEEDGSNSAHIRKQITLLNKAFITTMHSFCIDVVRSHFHMVDIDPSFRIADTTESSIIIQETLEDLLEREYEKADEEFISLVESFGGNREDIKVQELMLSIYYFIQSQPYPLKWLEESIDGLDIDEEGFEGSPWGAEIKKGIRVELMAARDMLSQAHSICNMDPLKSPAEYREAIECDIENVESLISSLESGLSKLCNDISDISHKRLASIRGSRKDEIDDELREKAKGLRDQYKAIVDSIKSDFEGRSVKEHANELRLMYPAMKKLSLMVGDFDRLYSKHKLEKGLLDFNDLEHYTLKILEDEGVRRELSRKFEYIFIDEYQDSNIVQETIVERIKREDNLFMVGDVKQSIYRFRLADPNLFIQKYENYKKDAKSRDMRVDLSMNFRSRPDILSAVNFIFKSIMSKELGEVEYDEHARLNPGAKFADCEYPSVEIDVIRKNGEDEQVDAEIEELSTIEVEARFAAKKIKSLIGKRTYDPKKGEYREIQYKDIVVLLRTIKNWAPSFKEVLREEGIPVYSDDTGGYFDVIEIQIFLNLLRLIDNKMQDIPMISVMKSPIGGFAIEDLINIRIGKNGISYSKAVMECANEEGELSKKVQEFLSKIERWAEDALILRLDEFIWKLLVETGYYYYVGAMPSGEQRQANLRILVDRAAQFENSSINGLFNFIRFVDKLLKSNADMGSAKILGENENLVRIMSVHKSKGLEFPVVIIAGLGKRFNLRDSSSDVLLHKELGAVPKYVDYQKRIYKKTLAQTAVKKRMDIESLSEEMRILYVAMTRAVDRLIMMGSVGNIENACKKWCTPINPYMLSKASSHIDWICSAVSRHEDAGQIRCIAGMDDTCDIDSSKFKVSILDRTDINIEESFKEERLREYKELLYSQDMQRPGEYDDIINSRFSWEYPHRNAEKIPSKMSVTQLADANIKTIGYNIPPLVKKPMFMEEKRSFGAAERGTILHFAMKNIDIHRARSENEIDSQLEEMVLKELLNEEEKGQIDILKIKGFFESEIGMRIKKSKKVFREAPFVMKKSAEDIIEGLQECGDNILIQGIIDCYFQEGESMVLVDYKSDKIEYGLEAQRAQSYREQLGLYSEAIEKITGKSVAEGYIYFFETGKEVRIL